jgi:hypothetical protein
MAQHGPQQAHQTQSHTWGGPGRMERNTVRVIMEVWIMCRDTNCSKIKCNTCSDLCLPVGGMPAVLFGLLASASITVFKKMYCKHLLRLRPLPCVLCDNNSNRGISIKDLKEIGSFELYYTSLKANKFYHLNEI